jgi:hypothetical protein
MARHPRPGVECRGESVEQAGSQSVSERRARAAGSFTPWAWGCRRTRRNGYRCSVSAMAIWGAYVG